VKAYEGSGGIDPLILNFDTRWRWVVTTSCLWPLYPRKEPGHSLRRLGGGGLWTDLDVFEERKICCSCWESNPGSCIM
jgi:hypothetical protein